MKKSRNFEAIRRRLCVAWLLLLLSLLLSGAWAEASSCGDSLPAAFRHVGQAVVIVRTTGRVPASQYNGQLVNIAGLGSGVLVDTDGKVMTAAHVVQTADSVRVEFPGDVLVNARIIASDAAADVALLLLERVPHGVVPAQLGDSDIEARAGGGFQVAPLRAGKIVELVGFVRE